VPKLYIAEDDQESVYEIFDQEVSLGRGAANGVQIHNAHASKVHAVVRRIQGHWKLIDLESKNGTRVNGRYRNQYWLRDGDAIAIGTSTLRYEGQGAPQGSPAAAAGVAAKAVSAKAVPARSGPAKPAPARPVPATPAPAAPLEAARPAPPTFTEEPLEAPAVPVVAGTPPARSAPVSPSRRTGASSAPRRSARPGRDDDRYDDDYDDEDDRPRYRKKSNNSAIIILGALGAIAFLVVMFAMFGSSMSQNEEVLIKADRMADKREYAKAIQYAEQNGDPSGDDYGKLMRKVANWKDRLDAQKSLERSHAAQTYFDHEIYRKQAITGRRRGGFRAKDALPDREVVRLLRDFLTKYGETAKAAEILHSDLADFEHFRDAMREYASPDLKSTDVLQGVQAQVDIDVSARRYGKAVMKLEYLRDMNRLCMTTEHYTELRKAVELKVQGITDRAYTQFDSESREFTNHLKQGRRSKARAIFETMKREYTGIDELSRKVRELEQRLDRR